MILNFLTIGLLVFFAKRNGQSFWQLINYQKGKTTWKQIVGVTLLVLVVGMSGMYLAGFLCYNNFLYAPPVMIAPIPKVLAIINVVLLPIMVGHALIDLATAAQIVATSFVPGLYQTMCGQ